MSMYSNAKKNKKPAKTQHPVLLCLDLNVDTGWAVVNHNGHVMSGIMSFQPRRFEQEGMRYFRFSEWLNEISCIIGHIEAVYFKKMRRQHNIDATQRYGGFFGALTVWCEQKHIPYYGIHTGAIKKCITGKGNAHKNTLINAIYALGYHPKADTENQAIALLHYACIQHAAKGARKSI